MKNTAHNYVYAAVFTHHNAWLIDRLKLPDSCSIYTFLFLKIIVAINYVSAVDNQKTWLILLPVSSYIHNGIFVEPISVDLK